MEDGGHYGNSAVHKGGRGDGDQGRTEGKGEFRVFKVGLIEIEIIYSDIYEAFALEIYLKPLETLFLQVPRGTLLQTRSCSRGQELCNHVRNRDLDIGQFAAHDHIKSGSSHIKV